MAGMRRPLPRGGVDAASSVAAAHAVPGSPCLGDPVSPCDSRARSVRWPVAPAPPSVIDLSSASPGAIFCVGIPDSGAAFERVAGFDASGLRSSGLRPAGFAGCVVVTGPAPRRGSGRLRGGFGRPRCLRSSPAVRRARRTDARTARSRLAFHAGRHDGGARPRPGAAADAAVHRPSAPGRHREAGLRARRRPALARHPCGPDEGLRPITSATTCSPASGWPPRSASITSTCRSLRHPASAVLSLVTLLVSGRSSAKTSRTDFESGHCPTAGELARIRPRNQQPATRCCSTSPWLKLTPDPDQDSHRFPTRTMGQRRDHETRIRRSAP